MVSTAGYLLIFGIILRATKAQGISDYTSTIRQIKPFNNIVLEKGDIFEANLFDYVTSGANDPPKFTLTSSGGTGVDLRQNIDKDRTIKLNLDSKQNICSLAASSGQIIATLCSNVVYMLDASDKEISQITPRYSRSLLGQDIQMLECSSILIVDNGDFIISCFAIADVKSTLPKSLVFAYIKKDDKNKDTGVIITRVPQEGEQTLAENINMIQIKKDVFIIHEISELPNPKRGYFILSLGTDMKISVKSKILLSSAYPFNKMTESKPEYANFVLRSIVLVDPIDASDYCSIYLYGLKVADGYTTTLKGVSTTSGWIFTQKLMSIGGTPIIDITEIKPNPIVLDVSPDYLEGSILLIDSKARSENKISIVTKNAIHSFEKNYKDDQSPSKVDKYGVDCDMDNSDLEIDKVLRLKTQEDEDLTIVTIRKKTISTSNHVVGISYRLGTFKVCMETFNTDSVLFLPQLLPITPKKRDIYFVDFKESKLTKNYMVSYPLLRITPSDFAPKTVKSTIGLSYTDSLGVSQSISFDAEVQEKYNSNSKLQIRDDELIAYTQGWVQLPFTKTDVVGSNLRISLEGVSTNNYYVSYANRYDVLFTLPETELKKTFDTVRPLDTAFSLVYNNARGIESSNAYIFRCTNDVFESKKITCTGLKSSMIILEQGQYIKDACIAQNHALVVVSSIKTENLQKSLVYGIDLGNAEVLNNGFSKNIDYRIEQIRAANNEKNLFFLIQGVEGTRKVITAIFDLTKSNTEKISAPILIPETEGATSLFGVDSRSLSDQSMIRIGKENFNTLSQGDYSYSIATISPNPSVASSTLKKFRVYIKDAVICPNMDYAIVWERRLNSLYVIRGLNRKQDFDRERGFYQLPFLELGLRKVIDVQCLGEKNAMIVLAKDNSNNNHIVVYEGKSPDNVNERLHAIISTEENSATGIHASVNMGVGTIIVSLIKPSTSGSSVKIFHFDVQGPKIMLKVSEQNPGLKSVSVIVNSGDSPEMKSKFQLKVIKETNIASVGIKEAAKQKGFLKLNQEIRFDLIADIIGPISYVEIEGSPDPTKMIIKNRKESIGSYFNHATGYYNQIEVVGEWLIAKSADQLNLDIIRYPTDKTKQTGATQFNFPKAFGGFITGTKFVSFEKVKDRDTKRFMAFTKIIDSNLKDNIMLIFHEGKVNDTIDNEPSSQFQEISDIKRGYFKALRLTNDTMLAVELSNDGHRFVATRYTYLEDAKQWVRQKLNDNDQKLNPTMKYTPASIIDVFHRVTSFDLVEGGDNGFLYYTTYDSIDIGVFYLPKYTPVNEKNSYQIRSNFNPLGEKGKITVDNIVCEHAEGPRDVECYLDSIDAASHVIRFEIDAVSSSNSVRNLKQVGVFYKPSNSRTEKLDIAGDFVSLLYRPIQSNPKLMSSIGLKEANDCDYKLMIFKIGVPYSFITFSCSDFNIKDSKTPPDFALEKTGETISLWLSTMKNPSDQVQGLVKGYSIQEGSIKLLDKNYDYSKIKLRFFSLSEGGAAPSSEELKMADVAVLGNEPKDQNQDDTGDLKSQPQLKWYWVLLFVLLFIATYTIIGFLVWYLVNKAENPSISKTEQDEEVVESIL